MQTTRSEKGNVSGPLHQLSEGLLIDGAVLDRMNRNPRQTGNPPLESLLQRVAENSVLMESNEWRRRTSPREANRPNSVKKIRLILLTLAGPQAPEIEAARVEALTGSKECGERTGTLGTTQRTRTIGQTSTLVELSESSAQIAKEPSGSPFASSIHDGGTPLSTQ